MKATLVRPQVDVIEDEFEQPCEVCMVRPTAVLVRIAEPDFEALEKVGESAPPETVTKRYYCAEHIGAVNELLDSYRS